MFESGVDSARRTHDERALATALEGKKLGDV